MALRFPDDPLYQLLRAEKVDEFNQQKSTTAVTDFNNCDFRGLDLRGLDASNINFDGCYFRTTDLRGIDFSQASLNGASLASAHISGCLFPTNIDPNEISLSLAQGTRMRAK